MLDIPGIALGETIGQANRAVFQLRSFEVANAVERSPFTSRELSDSRHDRFDHIGLGRSEFLTLGELVDARIDANGEQLVLGGGGIGHR